MKEIIAKIKSGDSLSNEELDQAISHYSQLENLLEPHGEVFHLSYIDVCTTLRQLESYKKSRADKSLTGVNF